MWTQKTIQLKARARVFHLITRDIEQALPVFPLACFMCLFNTPQRH